MPALSPTMSQGNIATWQVLTPNFVALVSSMIAGLAWHLMGSMLCVNCAEIKTAVSSSSMSA